jgi:hypothetical protein
VGTQTIELGPKDLEEKISVLFRAAEALQLTRYERYSYRALIVSVYLITGSFISQFIYSLFIDPIIYYKWFWPLVLEFHMTVFLGLLSLGLNAPLFFKVFHEKARLKELGIDSLTESLWRDSRWRRWQSRALGGLLILTGICTFLIVIFLIMSGTCGILIDIFCLFLGVSDEKFSLLVFFSIYWAIIAALLIGARYLHSQRERMRLTANAQELNAALKNLRQHVGKAGVALVPSKLLEQTAKIEWAEIAKDRKDAVLQSVAFPPTGFTIAFDRDAAEQRATLAVADRVEVEDLAAQLSTHGAQLDLQPGAVGVAIDERATLRGTTESKRVEIEYVIDHAARAIRVIAVRHKGDSSFSAKASHV